MKSALLVALFLSIAHLCVGQLSQLSQLSQWNNFTFPGDPEINITIFATIQDDGYKVERINSLGTHTGTHMSAPCHFFEGPQYKCIDQLPASAFVFTAARINASLIPAVVANPTHKITWAEIKAYETLVGKKIPTGSLVMLYTGLGPSFGTPAYENTPFPGFSEDAVNKMFEKRFIKGLGSDTFGPDASDDAGFEASSASYLKGGITIENMANLDQLGRRFGDIVVATPARLKNGSGFQTNVIALVRS